MIPIEQGDCPEVVCSHMTSALLNMGCNTTNGSLMSMAPPAGVDELWGQVLMELDRIPEDICRKLIESRPRLGCFG